MKKYPSLNLRLSQDLQENLRYLAEQLGIEDTEGADPKIVRIAVRSLKFRFKSLQEEFGRDFVNVFKFKIQSEIKETM